MARARILQNVMSSDLMVTVSSLLSCQGCRTLRQQNSVEIEASLAPAKAEVGAVAKTDQY